MKITKDFKLSDFIFISILIGVLGPLVWFYGLYKLGYEAGYNKAKGKEFEISFGDFLGFFVGSVLFIFWIFKAIKY